MMPRGGCIFWYTWIYLYKYDYVMDFNLMVMLRSTTSPYGRPVIEVAYGETIFHSTEAVQEMVAREEWLGCRHDASPMSDIPGSTPVWAPYTFFWFSIYQNLYICITFSKPIYSIKNTGGLWPCPGPIRFRECFRPPMSFQNRIWTTDNFYVIYCIWVL